MGSAAGIVVLASAGVIVVATGVFMTRSGRPYGAVALNVHKLVDLAAVVFIGTQAVAAARNADLAPIDGALLIASALLTVATFATGGLVSANQTAAGRALTAHRVLPWPLLVVLGCTAFRLVARS